MRRQRLRGSVTEGNRLEYEKRVTGSAHDIGGAWDRVFSAWLPASGYQPDDRPCLEVYRGRPGVDAKAESFRCDLCLPVRPL